MSKNTEALSTMGRALLNEVTTGEGLQKYILGTKKNGQPRALYDIIKDCTKMGSGKGKKGKKKKSADNTYAFYLSTKDTKKKHKKKKKNKDKNKDYWHI